MTTLSIWSFPEPGATIVEVRAHLDPAIVAWTATLSEHLLRAQR